MKACLVHSFVLLAVALTACTSLSPQSAGDDQCKQARYDGKKMEAYVDSARKFKICLPEKLSRLGPDGTADGRIVFSGFAVPPGTNLESKTLIIVPAPYDELQGATAFGHFAAGGVTFQRVKVDEGSAGHSTLHVIYTWKMSGGKKLYFDFTHFAVNPLVFDPGNRPAVYDQAAQVKLTEEIMSTFTRLH